MSPWGTRLSHFVRAKNLPFTMEDVKTATSSCSSCAYLKPKFHQGSKGTLIRALAPFQRLAIDFKGPLPVSKCGNQYLLTIIDEYSRFPFAFPCSDMKSSTVTNCFNQLFSVFGLPNMVHNDRAPDFLSEETVNYLHSKGVATSKTSRYNPQGNGQVEKLNGTLWKAIQVTLHSRNLKVSEWETVLPDALHSIRSLLCTATNATPHERLFNYSRQSTAGKSIPSWIKPGPVYLKNHTRKSKYDPPVSPVSLSTSARSLPFHRWNQKLTKLLRQNSIHFLCLMIKDHQSICWKPQLKRQQHHPTSVKRRTLTYLDDHQEVPSHL